MFRSARHHDDESTVEFSESFDTRRDVGGSSWSYADRQKKTKIVLVVESCGYRTQESRQRRTDNAH